MDPKTRSLAQRSGSIPSRVICALAAGVVLWGGFLWGEEDTPVQLPLTEHQLVHRVQIDVSIIDPRGRQWASVSGIPRDAFRLWVDGVPLDPETARRTEFDEICDGGETASPATTSQDAAPTILVLIDLNYLDARMRFAVVKALEALADEAAKTPLRTKILSFYRRVRSLTEGLTGDPEKIREAARRLAEMTSEGPPRNSLTQALEEISRDPQRQIRSATPLGELDDDTKRDPRASLPAMTITLPGQNQLLETKTPGINEIEAPSASLGRTRVDPRPSLAAIESVLLSHSSIRGRKALVLFSSGWFDLPEELWFTYVSNSLQAAQRGFAIWPVDSRGLLGSRGGDSSSRLMGYLSASTGGELIESAGRLSVAFDRALEQLSCYYLFSIPIPPPARGSKRHTITVALDTKAHPEYWHYQVRYATGIMLLDRERLRQRRKLAALMEPSAHRYPEVRVTAAYPDLEKKRYLTPVEVSVVLSDLVFEREAKGKKLRARFGWEGLVTDSSQRTVCRLGDGRERHVRVAQTPARFPPALLILRDHCSLPGPGRYHVLALVEDLATGEVGAAEALFGIPQPAASLSEVSALRLGRNSGRDFLLEASQLERTDVPRDRARRGFVPLARGEAIASEDRLMLRFVGCGIDRPPATVLFKIGDGQDPSVRRSLYQLLVSQAGVIETGEGRCTEYQALVPENTLGAGHYGIALFDPAGKPRSREELDEWLGGSRTLAVAEFKVDGSPPPAPAPPDGRRTAIPPSHREESGGPAGQAEAYRMDVPVSFAR